MPECYPARSPDEPQQSIVNRIKSHMLHEDWHTWSAPTKLSFVKTEVLLGITICFAQVPESVAFAFMAHIKPPVALHAAWVVGLICTIFGGRSGMVNGAEGAYAAIIATFIDLPEEDGGNGDGIVTLFPSVMCAGGFMLLVWLLQGDRFITLMAASIMDGFCCGIAIVIGLSQLHPFQEGHGSDATWRSGSEPETWFMVLIAICSMLTMEFIPQIKCTGRFEKYKDVPKLIPSSLIAILVSMFIEYAIVENLNICSYRPDDDHRRRRLEAEIEGRWLTATDPGTGSNCGNSCQCKTTTIADTTPFTFTYPYPFFLDDEYHLNGTSSYSLDGEDNAVVRIMTQGLLLGIAGIVQGLMTTEVVTSFVKTPAHTPSIVWSMGVANLVSGFLGGMGGDAMIGLSTINCLNGGKGRLGPTVTATGVMLCTMVAYPLLNYIPIASLAGVMIVVVLHTFKWGKLPMVAAAAVPEEWRPKINKYLECKCWPKWLLLPLEVDRWEAFILVIVSVLTIVLNLAYAVFVGLILAALRFTWASSQETYVRVTQASETSKRYVLDGRLFFGCAMRFHNHFAPETDPPAVTLEMAEQPFDYSATEALARLTGLYQAQGKTLTIEVVPPAEKPNLSAIAAASKSPPREGVEVASHMVEVQPAPKVVLSEA